MLTKKINGVTHTLSSEEEAIIRKKWEEENQRILREFELYGYKEARRREYPKIEDQLDMLYHAIDSDTPLKESEFYTRLKSVKDKYPKPTEAIDGSDQTNDRR